MPNTMTPLEPNDPFQFACSPQVPCFNACCHDLNQFLYPYDIIRLKQALQIDSSELLQKYTNQHIGPETGLPIVSLRPRADQELACPFVTPGGCGVYSNRPASCRLYPLARAITRQAETGTISEHFALIQEDHCHGFKKGSMRTARQWMKDQGVIEYNIHNDRMITLLRLKREHHPKPLALAHAHLFYRTLYDLDHFRTAANMKKVFQELGLDSDQEDAALTDDTGLLKIAEKWIVSKLFGTDAI